METTLKAQIQSVLNEMEREKPGSEQYGKLVQELNTLKKLEIDEEKERNSAELELKKVFQERVIAEDRNKTARREAVLGVVKTSASLLAAGALAVFAVYSEETRVVAGKAWNMAVKVLRV